VKRIIVGLVFFLLAIEGFSQQTTQLTKPLQDELDGLHSWFLQHPYMSQDASLEERLKKTETLDNLCFELTNATWGIYRNKWNADPKGADQMEKKYPILYYLRNSENQAFDEIRNTKITSGLRVWQLYNIGIIVKTPEKCFSIDLNSRFAEKMIDVLDFAIVSHTHSDHYTMSFIKAMVDAGKPVYGTWQYFKSKNINVILKDKTVSIGPLQVKFTMSSQGTTPCLITQISFGSSTNSFVLIHSGDIDKLEGLPSGEKVDLYILNTDSGMDSVPAVLKVNPNVAVFSHLLEMSHTNNQRLNYKYAASKNQEIKTGQGLFLTWGESLQFDFEDLSATQ